MKYKLLLLIFASLFFGCNDDFLERYPLSSVSAPTFWNTEKDLSLYNTNLYAYASSSNLRMLVGHNRNMYWRGQEAFDGMTDNDVRGFISYYPEYSKIRAGQIYPDQSTAEFGWNDYYFEFIRSINIGLANYDKADLPEKTINLYKGEAYLFRAWAVANKVSLYGDFPWLDQELNTDSPELNTARTDRETVMEHVLEDLNFACENLPSDWGDGNEPGRLNRWCALLVKSRICLFEGTWRKYHGLANSDMWLTEAAEVAGELLNDGPYQLYLTGSPANDYKAIFQMADLTGINEVMYWRRYDATACVTRFQTYNAIFSSISKSMVYDYLCTDGNPITTSSLYKGDVVYEDIFENRDPRLRQTVLHPDDLEKYDFAGFYTSGASVPRLLGQGGYGSYTGFHSIKYYNREQHILDTKGTHPSIILRYAEALLNYAEAKAELGTINQGDLDVSINKLRDRVGMPHMDISNIPIDPKYTNDGVSPLIVEIRRERRIELYAEGFRYNDLRRWKQGEKLRKKDYGMRWDAPNRARFDPDNKCTVQYEEIEPGSGIEYLCPFKGSAFENPIFEDKHYLWPVPISALSLSPDLGQNPGWE